MTDCRAACIDATGGQVPRSFCVTPGTADSKPLLIVGNQESDSVRSYWIDEESGGGTAEDAAAARSGGPSGADRSRKRPFSSESSEEVTTGEDDAIESSSELIGMERPTRLWREAVAGEA